MAKKSKKYLEAAKKIDSSKAYSVQEAIALAKETDFAKFDASVEVAYRLGLDPKKLTNNYVEQQFFQTELVKLNVYQYSQKVKKLKKLKQLAQTTLVTANQLKKSKADWFEFDVIVATPDMMGEVGRLGRVLGPKGFNAKP